MKQIKEEWGNIYRLSKVILKGDLMTDSFKGHFTLKKGTYFISGFWGDAMGLSETLKDAREYQNKWVIPSRDLENFWIGD